MDAGASLKRFNARHRQRLRRIQSASSPSITNLVTKLSYFPQPLNRGPEFLPFPIFFCIHLLEKRSPLSYNDLS